jgi:hypothetical protein
MTHLRTYGVRKGICHRAMIEGPDQAPLTVHRQVARRPNRRGADIAGKNRVFGGEFVEHAGNILRMHFLLARSSGSKFLKIFACPPVIF